MRRILISVALLAACKSDIDQRRAFAAELAGSDAWVDDRDGIELVISAHVCNAERVQRLAESREVRHLGFVLVKCEGMDPRGVRDE
jgi:hypothetical protein